MNKTLVESIIVLVLACVLGGVVYFKKSEPKEPIVMCPMDVMVCPDGSTVPRSGPDCEFGICKQELPSYLQVETSSENSASSSSTSLSSNNSRNTAAGDTPQAGIVKKTMTTITSLVKDVVTTIADAVTPGNKVTTQTNQNNPAQNNQQNPAQQTPVTEAPPAINETRYSIVDGNIVDQNNNIIFILPTTFNDPTGSYTQTHAVNAVAVNQVAPLIGVIPVTGLPGKYYLSVNSLGASGTCIFSNKIYILDINTGVLALMYEENNTTLGTEDPRACTSEIFLLATENKKLILKYHTINTNTVCESTWSEPENTWFLDVTETVKGTKRYYITGKQYVDAEQKEKACRAIFDASSTPRVDDGPAG